MASVPNKQTDRFWSKVIKTDSCWLWTGNIVWVYGYLGLSSQKSCPVRERRAHRISWVLHCGAIPDGLFVLHRCDVRRCVNPEHLFLGTQAMNIADAKRKGRLCSGDAFRATHPPRLGEENNSSKLRDSEVIAIREEMMAGKTKSEISRKYGISRVHV